MPSRKRDEMNTEGMTPSQAALDDKLLSTFATTVNDMQNGDSDPYAGFQQSQYEQEKISRGMGILMKYKAGKQTLESKIIANEQWWQMRHWNYIKEHADFKPKSAWLFNCIANKHADIMDSYPSANILPRELGDIEESRRLSSIIPAVLEQNGFKRTYDSASWYKLLQGSSVYAVVWDGQKMNGLGDISINKIDLLNVFWEPGIDNIQQSPNFFVVNLVNNEMLESEYPSLRGTLGSGNTGLVATYVYDETIDTTNMSYLVDWYYRKRNSSGRYVVHYCKFCGEKILYDTEMDEEYRERGIYDHGRYPFVFDSCYPKAGSPVGFGYVDICKDTQRQIDVIDQAVVKNAIVNATPRYFISESAGLVSDSEFTDLTTPLVHVKSNATSDVVVPIRSTQLSSTFRETVDLKINEMKETTGNRDVSTGGTASGVTAASAIAALQEAGSKLSRDLIRSGYMAYEEIIYFCIELIRQFYDLPRQFRIMGQKGQVEYITYKNSALVPQQQSDVSGVPGGYRIPQFDIEIVAQKASPYTKLSQNEMALQFFQLGFFNPELADQAIACLEMMDFERKDTIMENIAKNQTLFKENQMLKSMVIKLAESVDPAMAQQMAASVLGQPLTPSLGNSSIMSNQELVELDSAQTEERKNVEDARNRSNSHTDVSRSGSDD